ncbi:hypothetical protein BDA96_10G118000 [Sorghum bicolor]|uniref:Uncharacterized protein n=2 Tax=Sorghum bicolor TaxID=4558 RepID=A0A921Q2K9_SORBI|nr:hypothetical protein BDA96_10G118000 [Sorghum bicolor]OQU76125.1 hypothetical protein SORBI_3010G096801 [Sorghum bicolor]
MSACLVCCAKGIESPLPSTEETKPETERATSRRQGQLNILKIRKMERKIRNFSAQEETHEASSRSRRRRRRLGSSNTARPPAAPPAGRPPAAPPATLGLLQHLSASYSTSRRRPARSRCSARPRRRRTWR